MQDSLVEALHTVSHRCLGRKLKPFTLQHAFSLAVAENPFLTGSKHTPTLDDLRQAVEICSRPSDFFMSGRRPSGFCRDLWRLRTRRADLTRESLRFHTYLDDFCAMPEVWQKTDGKARPLKVNWIFSAVVGLMMDLGMTEAEAWLVSPGKAQWLLVAAAERNPWGSVDILSEEEEAAIAALNEFEPEEDPDGG